VTSRDVRDFVTNDGRQLVLVLGNFEDTAEDANLAAGHCKSVDRLLLKDREFPLDVVVGRFELLDHGLRDTGHKIDCRPVGDERHARAHLVERPCSFCLHFDPALLRRTRRASRKQQRHASK
jgi:hypothetical protein